LAGLSRKMLFDSAYENNANFSLYSVEDCDLYTLTKQSMVGGASIIFSRFHSVDKTFIRNDPKEICKAILGYDASSLYLYCLAQKMPTGPYVRRFSTSGFKPVINTKHINMYYWMDWVAFTTNTHIDHMINSSREKSVGVFLLDGVDHENRIAYEVSGCIIPYKITHELL